MRSAEEPKTKVHNCPKCNYMLFQGNFISGAIRIKCENCGTWVTVRARADINPEVEGDTNA